MGTVANTLKFSEAGVRGIVGDGLTPQLTVNLASAFACYVGYGKVVVGRDTRQSGKMIEKAVIAGLTAVGCQVVLLDIVATPTVQLMVRELKARGGIAITASHNPSEWNALKFIAASGMFLDSAESQELFDIYTQSDFRYCPENEIRAPKFYRDSFKLHQEKIFKHIDVAAIKACKFRVALDCCNGVGALFSKPFLEALGCKVYSIFDSTSRGFERQPEPIAENLGALSELVKKQHCAVGFAHDPDGDRMALVANNGVPLGEQYTVLLAVEHVLSEHPSAVVVNAQTTRAVEEVAKSYGCKLYYSKVGEINVVKKMLATKSQIGGEGSSAGVIWRRIHPGRDSFVVMALVLEMLALSRQSMEEIATSLPHYYTVSKKFSCSAYRAREIVLHLSKRYYNHTTQCLDGVRVNFKEGWLLVRPSNTEPVLRLTVEATCQSKANRLIKLFERLIRKLIVTKPEVN